MGREPTDPSGNCCKCQQQFLYIFCIFFSAFLLRVYFTLFTVLFSYSDAYLQKREVGRSWMERGNIS